MNIGNLKLSGNLVLAPMADVTNLPFRLLSKKYGASLVYSEMVFSHGILWKNRKSMARCLTCREERPMGIQLSGPDAGTMANSARIVIENYRPDILDINLGCPAHNVTKKGCGSALLGQPEKVGEMVGQVSEISSIPVTVKIRVLDSSEKTRNIARLIESSGASALTVHGRTRKQKYSGDPDIDIIRKIKKELSIPVIANGNITDERTAEHVLEHTGCDGLMIGRAAIGNPYIFRRIKNYLEKGELMSERSFEEQLDDFFEYMSLCNKYGITNFRDIKVKAQWATKSMKNGRIIRERLNGAKDIDSVISVMEGLKET